MDRGRAIKFRAWDKVRKEFICEGFHVYGEVTMFSLIDQHLHETKKEGETTLGNLDRVEITQFTGLVDKNGKDIYDGDILKSLGTDIRVVECDNANACYRMRCLNSAEEDICPFNDRNVEHREIIGNIYQCPPVVPQNR